MFSSHAVINLEGWEGATFYQEFTWETGDPAEPVDLTDVTARMQVRADVADDDPVFDLTTENGGIIILSPATDGKYAILITPTQTLGICPDHEKRSLVYDLFFDHGTDNDTGMQQRGKFTFNPAVTRAE
ncbi:MAG TPA: hypothetical protein DDZ40_07305 [Deltaproteobacteria bacterium]|nr:hypothetical protein [Deltaproteobacteria bacterium]